MTQFHIISEVLFIGLYHWNSSPLSQFLHYIYSCMDPAYVKSYWQGFGWVYTKYYCSFV